MVNKSIEELKLNENNLIIEVMAFMSYNPSIGRVLEAGGVKKFQEQAKEYAIKLKDIYTIEEFDEFHKAWVNKIIDEIKPNKANNESKCSYGQAQKAINVFLKLYCDWASIPENTEVLRCFLHVPLDRILMNAIYKHEVYGSNYEFEFKKRGPTRLKEIKEEEYYKWQNIFRKLHPDKPLDFDLYWAELRK